MHNLHLLLFLTAAIGPAASPQSGVVSAISSTGISALTSSTNLESIPLPPPQLRRETQPSPECLEVNGGEQQCCRALQSGDQELVRWLAKIYGYNMTPDVVNGLKCDGDVENCSGVKMCCRVTKLSPLLSMWCESPNDRKP
ncbi:hypothetical protein MGG_14879 [Pyricularia oryzae 70-15]|uniref:Hydrophobin n=1 Tax=Pyricularia oryzae (strain 70-15 / ATCC MYA-4617 / FGSC 8958) TaxID=242507 RepID=G4N946_PYRO7|nr:uncharacterized protein MGG_14879 [Pyricularia oryzae 70-15]EHA50290.1 hypothetical protein MGG_14879 [Pyricularia oryzae 70-15]KAI6510051.1 hypothetical protein MCOR13_001371 [Pyricularia oryzae]KAI6588630.1 hypothetical protein MCOR04_004111 [Pyricularia oryzae]